MQGIKEKVIEELESYRKLYKGDISIESFGVYLSIMYSKSQEPNFDHLLGESVLDLFHTTPGRG